MAASQSNSETKSRAARLVCVGFHGHEPSNELIQLVGMGVRVVILFERNVGDRDHVARLVHDIKSLSDEPILICVDQEGGNTSRLKNGFSPPPTMREIGNEGPGRAAQVGEHLAAELRPIGIDMNLAPVVDVDTNPENPIIGVRSFSDNPEHVGECGAALIRAMQAGGIGACAKHFPGHGDTAQDSHHELPVLGHDMERLRSVELRPFEAAIRAGVAAVMTAHIQFDEMDSSCPATLSPAVVNGLLRKEMGFGGVVIADDLEMEGISAHYEIPDAGVRAIEAGVDIVPCCHRFDQQIALIDALTEAISSGRISESRVEESIARIDAVFDRFVH